jgi:protein-disulfide isomerase-like protein with CxxC motif
MATTTLQNISEAIRGSRPAKAIKAKRKLQARRRNKKAVEAVATKLYRDGRDAVSSAYDSATQAGVRARIALPKLRNKLHLRERSQSVYTMMEERPLVLGAVGLGVGMVLATLLPSFRSHRSKR